MRPTDSRVACYWILFYRDWMGFLEEARPIAEHLPTQESTRLTDRAPLWCFEASAAKYSPIVFKFMQGVNKDKCAVRFNTTELFLAIRKYEATQQLRMKR